MTTPSSTPPPGPAQTAATCISCGRFIGPYERCPYCGAASGGRLSLRAIKIAAVVLATVGLAALWWLARHTEIPQLSIGEATGMMNLAYVRLNGRITRNLNYDPETGYLGFWLADETGEIHVAAYREVTTELFSQGRRPAIGDDVAVAGTLRVREDYLTLTLNVPEHLELDRPAATRLQAREVTLLDEGRRVRVIGEVQRTYVPYEGLTLITVADDTGEIVIAVDEVVTALTGPLPEIAEGQGIEVTGAVTLYKDTPQIVPAATDDIVLAAVSSEPTELAELTPPAAPSEPAVPAIPTQPTDSTEPTEPATPTQTAEPTQPPRPTPVPVRLLSDLTADDVGTTIHTRGRIVLLEGLKGGVKALLDDGTAQVDLLVWDRVYHALPDPTRLDVGAEVVVGGEIAVYEGALEIVPKDADDIDIVVSAPAPPWVEIMALSPADAGRVVQVRGVLEEPRGFSAGVNVPLSDGTGTITLLLWSNLYQQLPTPPAPGQAVEVVGVIDVYREALELVPRSIFDWRIRASDD